MSAIETRFSPALPPSPDPNDPSCAFPPFSPDRLHPLNDQTPRFQECHGDARLRAEALIRTRFAQAYSARIQQFMPRLFAVQDAAGQPDGACGVREAASGPLFLERYLTRPIEEAIALSCGETVSRGEVVEVGQFAGSNAGAFRCMIRLLTAQLHGEGHRWVVFTGTRALHNAFRRLGLSPCTLAPADPACLDLLERADWGSYYEHGPAVMFGNIAEGFRFMSGEALR